MDYFDMVSRLCAACGPSGYEGPAAGVAEELLRPLVDEISRDRLGNVVGIRRCGRENAPKILLDAHLDEVGLVVTGHKEGFLRVASLGGIDPRVLPDREVTICTQPPRLGVVAVKPPHLMAPGEGDKSVPLKELWIDTGLDQDTARREIPVGTPISYREEIFRLGEDRIAGKSLDDRSCFAILLEALALLQGEPLGVDVAVLGSAFEETSGAGALTATFAQDPDCAIAVDVTFGVTHDGPKETGFPLGSGPAIGVGPNCAHWMVELLKRAAKEEEIPYHLEVMAGETGTNGWGMQVAREGVPTAILSLPLNYMHTPLEVISAADAGQCARLLAAFLRRVGEEAALCWKN